MEWICEQLKNETRPDTFLHDQLNSGHAPGPVPNLSPPLDLTNSYILQRMRKKWPPTILDVFENK